MPAAEWDRGEPKVKEEGTGFLNRNENASLGFHGSCHSPLELHHATFRALLHVSYLYLSSYAIKREVKYSLHGIKAPEGHMSPRMHVSEHHSGHPHSVALGCGLGREFFFKFFFFGCGPFLKSLLNLLQHCFCFMFCFFDPETWDFSFLTKDETLTSCIGSTES